MTREKSQPPSSPSTRRRRRSAPRDHVPVLPSPGDEGQDADAAQRLVDDLLALVDAGLIAPLRGIDGVRYAIVDEPPTAA